MPRIAVAALAVILAACGRRTIEDRLTHSVAIVSTTGDRLTLADGSARDVPGIADLVAACPSMNRVEVKADGALFVLVEFDHWCGNDPVKKHIERVPLVPLIALLTDDTWAQPMSRRFPRGKLPVYAIYELVKSCGGTWDQDVGATFPGE